MTQTFVKKALHTFSVCPGFSVGASYKNAGWLELIYCVCGICYKDTVPLERVRWSGIRAASELILCVFCRILF